MASYSARYMLPTASSIISATASGEPAIAELGERALETGMGLLVPAEEVLDAGARHDEPDAQRVRVLRHDADALDQHLVAV